MGRAALSVGRRCAPRVAPRLPRLARATRVALAIVGGVDGDVAHEAHIREARADALIHVREQPAVGGDDGGHAIVVAIVDDLEELLGGPGGGVLGAEVVEHEHARLAHLVEEFVVGHLAAGREGGAQVIEQVRHDAEKDRLAAGEARVGDGSGEMRLANAIAAAEHQPAVWVLSVALRDLQRLAHARQCRFKGGEGLVAESVEARHAAQIRHAPIFKQALFAGAGDGLAKRGIAHWHVQAHVARAVALLADVRIAGRAGRAGARSARGGSPRAGRAVGGGASATCGTQRPRVALRRLAEREHATGASAHTAGDAARSGAGSGCARLALTAAPERLAALRGAPCAWLCRRPCGLWRASDHQRRRGACGARRG